MPIHRLGYSPSQFLRSAHFESVISWISSLTTADASALHALQMSTNSKISIRCCAFSTFQT